MRHDAGSCVSDASVRRDRSETTLDLHMAKLVAEHNGRFY